MSLNSNKSSLVLDDFDLLKLMVKDSMDAAGVYQPGPYWASKAKSSVNEIIKFGLSDFRGMKNAITTSFGDNAIVDARNNYNSGVRLIVSKILRNFYPFNRLFENQINLTLEYFRESVAYKNLYLSSNNRVVELISKYNLDFETTKGGCLYYGNFNGVNISHHYLQLLDTLDRIDSESPISKKKTFLEIGGGFGVNVHLIIELFKVKKIIYLDIAPNLYVGTQYLKSFYGDKVIDYKRSKHMESIKFSNNDELEIYCITPSQIEKIKSEIDLFHNAHSFVEMPEYVVDNYAKKIEAILSKKNSTVSLVSYDKFNLNSTFDPNKLPGFFNGNASKFHVPTLTPQRGNFHFVIQ